jgi:quinol monooxygenase YgiN
MIIEKAHLHILPEHAAAFEAAWREAIPIFARTPICHGAELYRGIEQPLEYTLLVKWTSVADHDAFRQTEDFAKWRQLVGPHFAQPPSVSHIEPVENP